MFKVYVTKEQVLVWAWKRAKMRLWLRRHPEMKRVKQHERLARTAWLRCCAKQAMLAWIACASACRTRKKMRLRSVLGGYRPLNLRRGFALLRVHARIERLIANSCIPHRKRDLERALTHIMRAAATQKEQQRVAKVCRSIERARGFIALKTRLADRATMLSRC